MPSTLNRGDRRRERTRRRLLDAARALIAERGVAGLRIQEITERADVGLGSFYNHFPDKEDLVEQVVGESLSDLARAIVTTFDPEADPAEIVASSCLGVVRLAFDDPEFARLVVNLSHADVLFSTAMYPFARTALENGIRTGRFVVLDTEVVLTLVVGGALALIREILDGRHAPGAEVAFARHALLSLGLSPTEATKITPAATPH